MAISGSILKSLLNLNHNQFRILEVEEKVVPIEKYGESFDQKQLHIHARPYKRDVRKCPVCGRKCPGYDRKNDHEVRWRAPNLNGVPVFITYSPERIKCPEHGVKTEWIPWADGDTRYTPDFNNEVTWLMLNCTRTAVAEYYGLNWRTVGTCITAAHNRLEPDLSKRFENLEHICIDETSYKKGHKYITVVYDMDRNRVVWVCEGHDNNTIEKFCLLLTEEQRSNIKLVAGDAAKWIDWAVKNYFPNADRCIDFFHVCQWANDALDDVRVSTARKAELEFKETKEELDKLARQTYTDFDSIQEMREQATSELAGMCKKGRKSNRQKELESFLIRTTNIDSLDALDKEDLFIFVPENLQLSKEQQAYLFDYWDCVKAVKGSKHALGHAIENCTDYHIDKIRIIENSYPDLYRAYQLKEDLRIILHMRELNATTYELDRWIDEAFACGLDPIIKLAEKILNHRSGILKSIEHQANSAKSEATNTTIKAIIRMARGFWNMDNMISLIYLKCSDIQIPLHNRPPIPPEYAKQQRERANERRRLKEEQRRLAAVAI